jgi:hypothetical protein
MKTENLSGLMADTNNDQFCEMEFQISSFALIALKNHDITLICENVKFLTNFMNDLTMGWDIKFTLTSLLHFGSSAIS